MWGEQQEIYLGVEPEDVAELLQLHHKAEMNKGSFLCIRKEVVS